MKSKRWAGTGAIRVVTASVVGASLSIIVNGGLSTATADVFVDDTPQASWRVNGTVYATEIVGDTVFVGGSFTTATSPTGQNVARRNLAAFSMSTGALRTDWRADAGAAVRAIESDGTSIYVGGAFGQVGGQTRQRLAKISVATGAVDPVFRPNVDNAVRAMEVDSSGVYIGGTFDAVNGVTRQRIAKLSLTGTLDTTFNARANNYVWGLAKAESSSVVYVSGPFTTVNGIDRNGVGGLNATTGATTGPAFGNAASPTLGLAVNEDGSRLYGAGGTWRNAVSAWNTNSGARTWTHMAMGDIQAVEYFQDTVYFGFHDGFDGNTQMKVLAADADTGALDAGFRPRFNRFWGVYAISVSPMGVVVGGDFTNVSGVAAQGWARFRGSAGADEEAPSTPANLRSTDADANSIDLAWNASSDDTGVVAYDIRRNGVVVGSTSGTAWTDTGLPAETSFSYDVRARDAAGNASPYSGELSAATTPPEPPGSTVTFAASHDASIRQSEPNANFGTNARLLVDRDPIVEHTMIRFDVSGVGGREVQRAVLRLHNLDRSDRGGSVTATDAGWNEQTITWANAPAAGATLGTLPAVEPGTWYEVDVTALVTGDGSVSVRITPQSANGADYSSSESNGLGPVLELTLGQ